MVTIIKGAASGRVIESPQNGTCSAAVVKQPNTCYDRERAGKIAPKREGAPT
jgi:hypothetical protein